MREGSTQPSIKGLLASPGRNKLALFALLLAFASGTFFYAYRYGGLFKGEKSSSINGWDDNYYYFWLRTVLVDHSVDFSHSISTCDSWDQGMRDKAMHRARTPLGLPRNKYPIGWAITGVPWFLIADLVSGLLNLAGNHVPLDGWAPIYQGMVVLGQAFYGCISLWFSFQIVARLFPARRALCGVLLPWLASPLFVYQTVAVSMSHGVLFFAATGAWYFTLRISEQPELRRHWMACGCFCALTVLARNQGAVLLVYPAALWLRLLFQRRCLTGHAAMGGACFLLTVLPQLIAWKLLYGAFVVYSYGGEGFHWLHPHLWDVLFSPLHGWFNWHPAMAIGSLGFFLWVWRERSLMA